MAKRGGILLKYVLSVLFLFLFSIGYIFFYFHDSNPSEENFTLPQSDKAIISLPSVGQKAVNRNFSNNDSSLPAARNIKEITISNEDVDRKTAKTPLTFPSDRKTVFPRLSPEEIVKAPIVDIVRMNIDNQNYDIVVVEKDGVTYDASDGVRIYVPVDYTELRRKKGMIP